MLGDPYVHEPLGVVRWAVAAVVLHDGVWVPLVLLAGLATGRLLPPGLRGPVRAGLLTATALTAVALPVLLRSGEDHGNPSLLPLDYLRGWLVCLAAVAAATAAAVLLRAVRRRGAARRGAAGAGGRRRTG
ncbi:hypothetical protein [Streptomyces sp. NPDC001380]|uniref:hypothetical protein n=1 Tax=Streptomyces sp. NPDC001380 TaxID=3364566 RepID=UPI00369C08CE